jgi:hypothetical protein
MNQNVEIIGAKTLKRASRRERLLSAMLEHPTLKKAAASIGISYVTAWRVIKTPEFQAEYRQARRNAVLLANARLQLGADAAAATLVNIMLDTNVPPAIRVRAAQDVLERAGKTLRYELTFPRGY